MTDYYAQAMRESEKRIEELERKARIADVAAVFGLAFVGMIAAALSWWCLA
ncbi:MAG TPA: hypothetical protein VGV37_06260 [Aliidongia sp.]|uniref:hypothetical protein n=1 Tax=Aliidongia sp. TaxID=1914230 RepID=UPI002DDCDAB2|nr:hypothetical protein [Aliidongia sp.]HEV2674128.1 hypothetical protein [Aliidongia sp.]